MTTEVTLLCLRSESNDEITLAGKLKHAMTAHPKIDVSTNELFFFGYDIFKKPYLQYSWVSSKGELAPSVPIELEFPTMIHDFVVTEVCCAILQCNYD